MSWSATLDAYAERLELMQQVLADGLQVTVVPFVPPTDLGPLPPELAERAIELFTQGADVEAMMLEAQKAIETALREVPPARRPAPRPSMVDVRA